MYKLVIVEDEESIRSSLEKYIPWNRLGFEVAGAFSDGLKAIDYIRQNPCDAVLTDIMMNVMSGLEMTRILHDNFPTVKVVILSGYNRFDYAQQAIRYRVSAYLLKPVDEDELIGVFRKIREELDKERADLQYGAGEELEFGQVVRQNFFTSLTERRLDTREDLMIYLKFLRIPEICLDCPIYIFDVSIARDPESEEKSEGTPEVIRTVLKERLETHEELFRSIVAEGRGDGFPVMVLGTKPDAHKILTTCRKELDESVRRVSGSIGCRVSYSLTHSADRISALLRKQPDSEEKNRQPQGEDMKLGSYQKVIMEYKLLIVEMNLGNLDVLQHLIDGVFFDLRGDSVQDIRFLMKNMFSSIATEYEKRKIAVWDAAGEGYSLDVLQSLSSAEEIRMFVRDCLFAMSAGLRNVEPETENGIVKRIKEHLEIHIGDEIVHDALASKFRIHPGYMSRLFKQTTGETVSGYLFRRRMEKAVMLLQNESCMVSEVAEMIGYPNASYFSYMFKKYTGYTPKEFRQRVLP